MRYEDIERMLSIDNRYKRRAGSGVFHRASRRGYIRGGIKTQSDFLSAKEKKLLNGDVKVSNVYQDLNNLPSFKELKEMKPEEASKIITATEAYNSRTSIYKHLNVAGGTFYGFLEKLGLYEPRRGVRGANKNKNNKGKKAQQIAFETPKTVENNEKPIKDDIFEKMDMILNQMKELKESKESNNPELHKPNGFKVEFNGEYVKADIENRLLSLAGILDGDSKYRISVILEETGRVDKIDLHEEVENLKELYTNE